MTQQRSSRWNVIDVHRPMKQELKIRRLEDPDFVFAKDGVHPNTAGHFIMAKTILLYLGAEEFRQAKDILSVLSQYKNGTEILAHTITLQKILNCSPPVQYFNLPRRANFFKVLSIIEFLSITLGN